jgi:hypothetical protein
MPPSRELKLENLPAVLAAADERGLAWRKLRDEN